MSKNDEPRIVSFRAGHTDPVTGEFKRDLFWERLGAESGDPDAMVQMGNAYAMGDGVEKDPEKACEYFLKAAELDQPIGQFNMGIHCARGEGVKRDFAAAIEWMERARDNGDEDAPDHLKRLADGPEWERKAYAGDPEAQARFSTLLANYPSPANVKESVEMAQRSVAQGCPRGYFCLGTRYDFGVGVRKDPVKAAELFKKGAELGSPDCQYSYAVCLKKGSGVRRDDDAAIEWAIKAAEQGNVDAALTLSFETANGSLPKPIDVLIGYLLKAEELEPDNVKIAGQLGVQYINLDPSDYEKAIYWYGRAHELGDENAAQMVHVYRYRQKLIDEGILPEDTDPMSYLQFLRENNLLAEAFGQEAEEREPQYDIDELLEGIETEDEESIKKYALACFLEGEKLYDHGIDTVRSMELIEKLAETDPEAAAIIGLLYQNGTGIEQDDDLAEKWLLKAAESGEAEFEKKLGQFYLDEQAPLEDMDRVDKALAWFRKAKENDEEAEFYFDILSYGKDRYENDELDEDASIMDIVTNIIENAQDGDEAALELTQKHSQVFGSTDED